MRPDESETQRFAFGANLISDVNLHKTTVLDISVEKGMY